MAPNSIDPTSDDPLAYSTSTRVSGSAPPSRDRNNSIASHSTTSRPPTSTGATQRRAGTGSREPSYVLEFPERRSTSAKPIIASTSSSSFKPDSFTNKIIPSSAKMSLNSMEQDSHDEIQGEEEGVWKILTVQRSEGMEDQFLVQLVEGGKKVRRSRSDLLNLAPGLLAKFDSSNSTPSPSPSRFSSDDDDREDEDSDIIMVEPRSRRSKRSTRTKRRSQRNDDEDERNETASEGSTASESGSNGEPSGEEESSSSEEDADDSGEFEVGSSEDEGRRSRRSGREKKVKTRKGATRHSTREGRNRVDYYAGGGEEMVIDDDDEESDRPTRRSTRQSESTTSSTPNVDDSEDDDELSIGGPSRKINGKGKGKAREVVVLTSESDELAGSRHSASPARTNASQRGEAVDDNSRPQDLHNDWCSNPKCEKRPASILLMDHEEKRRKKKPGRKKKRTEDEYDSDDQRANDEALGAWVECGTCVSSYHFACLSATLQKQLKNQLDAEHEADFAPKTTVTDPSQLPKIPKRDKVELDTDAVLNLDRCTACEKPHGTQCCVCEESGKKVTEFERSHYAKKEESEPTEGEDVEMNGGESVDIVPGQMFRCSMCKRPAHYGCLAPAEFDDATTTYINHVTSYFQDTVCHDCHKYDRDWQVTVDVIIGWREIEGRGKGRERRETLIDKKTGKEYVVPNVKDLTSPAEYLVKWAKWSYGDVDWVGHSWLASRYQGKLKHFLEKGSTVSFEPPKDDEPADGSENLLDFDDTNPKYAGDLTHGPPPDPNIEERIPKAWKTVERVLNVRYIDPKSGHEVFFSDFKRRPEDNRESVKMISRVYMKWGGLAYNQATEQPAPKEDSEGYEEFFKAYQSFIVASQPEMLIPRLSSSDIAKLDKPHNKGPSTVFTDQPDIVKNGKLMDFQVEGLNFLLNHWWVRKGCILADEMGLGKTCQIVCFLSYLSSLGARPFLIAVPNSLVSNWVREFEKWAPQLRVVPYSGDAESRKIVEDYEMFSNRNGSLKTHVVVVTYEALEKHPAVFARVNRWDCLVVDEGQRLKGGSKGALWRAIEKLHIGTKILLTGTPLNNNLRELYNLLHFLVPSEFPDVDALCERYADLTKEGIDEIRSHLAPYMLRRTKDQVLNLPPLGEFVVPVTLTLIQRQMYRGILERNSAAIADIIRSAGGSKTKTKGKTGMNILMDLRKTVNHPYLVSPELDPGNTVGPKDAFRQLSDASAKLVLLERMLPKLRAKGHKVLIFSQFKIVLNILELFLDGLDLKYLRLDGDTPQLERQRDVDSFQEPDSPYFAYLLSTRAGGVGLTLTAADVVIIFDQDWNPFQDLQAISRAHRIGQKNPVRVFKLVVKGTCEEKILQAGRKKQGLEHLIIQKIDAKDDETEDMTSALQYGAQAIFEDDDAEAEKTAKRYTDAEIDELLSKTAEPISEEAKKAAGAFATAQVWVSEKAGLVNADDAAGGDGNDAGEGDLGGFWDKVVSKQAQADREKKDKEEAENGGRARRTRKAVNYNVQGMSPQKASNQKKSKKNGSNTSHASQLSSDDDYRQAPEGEASEDDDVSQPMDAEDRHLLDDGKEKRPLPRPDLPVPNNSKSAARPVTDDKELARLRQKKLERRRERIKPLLAEAMNRGNDPARELLLKAYDLQDAVHQKELILKAVKHINDAIQQSILRRNNNVVNRPTPSTSGMPPVAAVASSSSSRPFTSSSRPVQAAPPPGPSARPPPIASEPLTKKRKSESPPGPPVKRASSPQVERPSLSKKPSPTVARPSPPVASTSATDKVQPPIDRSHSGSGSDATTKKKSGGFSQPQLDFSKPLSRPTISPPIASTSGSKTLSSASSASTRQALPTKQRSHDKTSITDSKPKKSSPVIGASTSARGSSANPVPSSSTTTSKAKKSVEVIILSDDSDDD